MTRVTSFGKNFSFWTHSTTKKFFVCPNWWRCEEKNCFAWMKNLTICRLAVCQYTTGWGKKDLLTTRSFIICRNVAPNVFVLLLKISSSDWVRWNFFLQKVVLRACFAFSVQQNRSKIPLGWINHLSHQLVREFILCCESIVTSPPFLEVF